MSKIRLLIFSISMLLGMFVLGGCGNAIPDLTEEEQRKVEEYAAYLVLKYDGNYQNALMSAQDEEEALSKLKQQAELAVQVQEQLALEEAQKEEQDASGDFGEGDSEQAVPERPVSVDIDEFLGIPEVDITFEKYTVCRSYPEDTTENDWQGITSATGDNVLIAFEYRLENKTDQPYLLDLASMDKHFSFRVNRNMNKTAITTLLLNDLSYLRQELAPGTAEYGVLLIEVSRDVAENLESVQMVIKYAGNRGEVQIL